MLYYYTKLTKDEEILLKIFQKMNENDKEILIKGLNGEIEEAELIKILYKYKL